MKGKRVRSNADYSSPYNIVKRICLKCNELFLSESPYNRICEECDSENKKMGLSVSVSILEETEILI